MSISKRFDPKSDDVMELIFAYEMLRLNCMYLLKIVKRTANNSCCVCCDDCLCCDAQELLTQLGEEK